MLQSFACTFILSELLARGGRGVNYGRESARETYYHLPRTPFVSMYYIDASEFCHNDGDRGRAKTTNKELPTPALSSDERWCHPGSRSGDDGQQKQQPAPRPGQPGKVVESGGLWADGAPAGGGGRPDPPVSAPVGGVPARGVGRSVRAFGASEGQVWFLACKGPGRIVGAARWYLLDVGLPNLSRLLDFFVFFPERPLLMASVLCGRARWRRSLSASFHRGRPPPFELPRKLPFFHAWRKGGASSARTSSVFFSYETCCVHRWGGVYATSEAAFSTRPCVSSRPQENSSVGSAK